MSFPGICRFAASLAAFVVIGGLSLLWLLDKEFREGVSRLFLGGGWYKL